MKTEPKRMGVLGCGLMGSGIVEVAARRGFEVVVREISTQALEEGRARIEASLERAVSQDKLTRREADEAAGHIRYTLDLSRAVAEADLVVEAVVEDRLVKRELFAELDRLASNDTILATNTSSIPIADLAAAVERQGRVIGLHFFNPVPVMPLVEVVPAIGTSTATLERTLELAQSLGKEAVVARDRSGFLVNLLLVPYLLDAVRQLDRGAASIEQMDRAMVLGCGHPMGPLALCDFVGIDTALRIAEVMYDEYREERYAPPPLLKRLVAMGRLGRKVGKGFYDYTGEEAEPLPI
ncbi:MAG: 3-hydroxybutyryl-CoA dehydrogenase [Gemmatimonadota bacterium]